VGGHKTKREPASEAFRELIRRRKRRKLLKLVGKVETDRRYDYKKERRAREVS